MKNLFSTILTIFLAASLVAMFAACFLFDEREVGELLASILTFS